MKTCLDLFKLSSCDNSGEFPASPSKTKITNAINISSMESVPRVSIMCYTQWAVRIDNNMSYQLRQKLIITFVR